jgi:NADP-dependent 3-hydroxy acid dehydrogenase YdfG
MMPEKPRALVTGASSGIGAATARRLAAEGYLVHCAARRVDRLEAVAIEIDGVALVCDVTKPGDVRDLARAVGQPLDLLVNNAGGAIGQSTVGDSDPDEWRQMFDLNVLGALQVTQALLPALVASGAGTIVNVVSTAGHEAYERGGGYVASKHALASMTQSLRRELLGQPVRVCEIAPGMVKTEEFSLNRFGGDRERADAVYAGVDAPLTVADIADAIAWVATRPASVNVDLMVVRPRAQISQYEVFRQD